MTNDVQPTRPTPDPDAGTPESARDAFLDLLLDHWPRIAAEGWDGFRRVGRGTVTVRDGSLPPALAYRAGAPCGCHADAVTEYDPHAQVVVAIVDDAGHVPWVHVLSGWPPPRLAAERLSAAARGQVLQ
jgi:hypothetical protein